MSRSSSLPWWTGSAARTVEKRLSKQQRLDRLNITDAEYQLYKSLFLCHRKPGVYSEQTREGSWPQFHWKWNDPLILRHLCSETNIAIPFADTVDQINVDIDSKGNRKWSDVEKTVVDVTATLPGNPLVYQSSESGGFRMIWFVNQQVSRNVLNRWTKSKLTSAGIRVKPGQCEVRLGVEPDRLPFGFHSLLVDPVTLEPLYHLTLSKTLDIVAKHGEWHRIDVELQETNLAAESGNYRQIIDTCLTDGLPPDITTTECLEKLAWYGRIECQLMNNVQLKEFLKNWITKFHNGNSTRINSGKHKQVFSQIDRILGSLRASPSQARITQKKQD